MLRKTFSKYSQRIPKKSRFSSLSKHHARIVTHTGGAAVAGYTAIVVQLLQAGADFAQVDEFGRTADSVADEKGFPETAAAVKEFAAANAK